MAFIHYITSLKRQKKMYFVTSYLDSVHFYVLIQQCSVKKIPFDSPPCFWVVRINTVNYSEVDKISKIVPFWFIYSVIIKYRDINSISFSIAAILLPYKLRSHAELTLGYQPSAFTRDSSKTSSHSGYRINYYNLVLSYYMSGFLGEVRLYFAKVKAKYLFKLSCQILK